MKCPICGLDLTGDIFLNDILSDHWRANECNLDKFKEESLDLYEFFITDALLLVNTLIELPTLRNLYLRIPEREKNYYLTYLRTSEDIENLTSFEPSFFDSLLMKFGFEQNMGNILPFIKLQSEPTVLLQIPYENLKNDTKIAILNNSKVNIIDISQICMKADIYFTENQLKVAFLEKMLNSETLQVEENSNSTAASTCTAFQRIEEIMSEEKQQQKSAFWETIESIQQKLLSDHSTSVNLNELLNEYLAAAINRRTSAIYCKEDYIMLLSALVPQLENIDEQKRITIKEAQQKCRQMFTFPHKMMFPTRKIEIQRSGYSRILEQVGIYGRKFERQTICGSNFEAQLLRNCLCCSEDVDYAVRYRNFMMEREVEMTQKAIVIQSIIEPRVYSVSGCDILKNVNTGNFLRQPADFSIKEQGKLTSIAVSGQKLYIGNEKGDIFIVNPLLSAVEQENVARLTYDYPIKQYNSINNIVISGDELTFTTDTGYLYARGQFFNYGSQIFDLDRGVDGLVCTSIGVFQGQKLLYQDATCVFSDTHAHYVGYCDGHIGIFHHGEEVATYSVSTLPIQEVVLAGDTIVVADAAAQLFSFSKSRKKQIGQLLQPLLRISSFSLGFLGHRVVLGEHGLIRILECDLKLFREVFINAQVEMSKFCELDSGSFALLLNSVDDSEVIVVDLLRDMIE